ncbi:hypothetical protein TNCV_4920901 [Trichonephila clavipes]|nr:hypothetical protein TNCV_4920901 [Trichonephila clavipes]
MVYVSIAIDGLIYLQVIRIGALTGRRYKDEIFRPTVAPFAATTGHNVMLVDYNYKPHRVNLVDDSLFKEGITQI